MSIPFHYSAYNWWNRVTFFHETGEISIGSAQSFSNQNTTLLESTAFHRKKVLDIGDMSIIRMKNAARSAESIYIQDNNDTYSLFKF
jgi:hypothetical protein